MPKPSTSADPRPSRLTAGRIVALYLALAGLWIFLSDRLLLLFTADPRRLGALQTAKGWLFVAVTALLLWVLIRRALAARMAAETQLRENQTLLRAIVEGTTDAVFTKDAAGRYRLVNRACAAIMGKSPQEILGQEDRALFPAAEAASFSEMDRRILAARQAITFEERVTRASGETLTMLTTKGPILDESGETIGLFGIARDISERDKAEQALRESEQRYRHLFKQNPHPMWVYDMKTLRFLAVNDAAIASYGYSRQEFLGMTIEEIRPPEDLPRLAENLARVTGGFDRAGIWQHRRKDGTVIQVEITSHGLTFDGRPAELVLADDVTERIRAETALGASEAKFRALVEQSITGIYVFEQDRFLYVNRQFAEIFGYSEEEILGRLRPTDVIAVEDRPMADEAVRRRLSGETDTAHYTARGRRKNGETIWVEVHGNRIELGDQPAVTGTVLDITERKQAEEELRRHRDHLGELVQARTAQWEAANRELEAFSYLVSHDLRTPLRAIAGFGGILARRHRSALDEEGRRYLDNIVLAAERMGRLIADLLAYARLGRREIRPQPVPLASVLNPLAEELAAQFRETGAALTVAEPLPTVLGHPTLLHQVFSNLFDNALTYRRPGIPVQITVSAGTGDDGVVVRVADNGIGIPPEHQEKIFNVFQRLHGEEEYPGTGIGLAIVRKAVGLMNGEVRVESTPGAGSTFVVRLPLP